jgi:hypothetical protein
MVDIYGHSAGVLGKTRAARLDQEITGSGLGFRYGTYVIAAAVRHGKLSILRILAMAGVNKFAKIGQQCL